MEVVVTGIGLVTALGQSQQEVWENLLAGQSGLRAHSIYPEYPGLLLGLVNDRPHSIRGLLEQGLPQAIHDAGLSSLPSHTGVVMGSSRGNQADLETLSRGMFRNERPSRERRHDSLSSATSGDQILSLTGWMDLYQRSPSTIAAQILGLQGPIVAPRAACATGLWAIAQGADLIRHQLAEVVIAGGVEAPITPLTIAGFQKMGALSNQAARPFDHHRSGFILGEGAAFFVLESKERASSRGQEPYGEVLGFGSSADGFHVSAPDPKSTLAIKAVEQCLARSQRCASAVEVIHTHGTGTILNDRNESSLIHRLFPHGPACTSSKGAIGHTLGASGAIGSAICLLGLKARRFPPCTGLQQRDPDCPINLLTATLTQNFQTALCLSFGFGGQNAAIAFRQTS